jgi:hypothetical protein
MHPETFPDQQEVYDYAEAHDPVYVWERMPAFEKRRRTLSSEQYEIVWCQPTALEQSKVRMSERLFGEQTVASSS